jgi:predicted DNA-binding transcriptional regulator YafY
VKGKRTSRVVWSFAMGFLDHAQRLAAWCEKRQAIRRFRLDRISLLMVLPDPYPSKRQALLKEWKAQQGLPLT